MGLALTIELRLNIYINHYGQHGILELKNSSIKKQINDLIIAFKILIPTDQEQKIVSIFRSIFGDDMINDSGEILIEDVEKYYDKNSRAFKEEGITGLLKTISDSPEKKAILDKLEILKKNDEENIKKLCIILAKLYKLSSSITLEALGRPEQLKLEKEYDDYYLGLVYRKIEKYSEAVSHFSSAYERTKCKTIKADICMFIGHCKVRLGISEEAKTSYLHSLKYYETATNYNEEHESLIEIYNSLGAVNTALLHYEEALEYYSKCYKIIKQKCPAEDEKDFISKKRTNLAGLIYVSNSLGKNDNASFYAKELYDENQRLKTIKQTKPSSTINSISITSLMTSRSSSRQDNRGQI